MEFSIVRVCRENYLMFHDMVFERVHGREKTEDERKEICDFDLAYAALDNDGLYVFAALAENRFIGWISIVYIPKVSWTSGKGHLFIDELWVNPAFRRKGIANALLAQADSLSREMDTLGLRLYVAADNDEAISLYERAGYENRFGAALFMEKEMEVQI